MELLIEEESDVPAKEKATTQNLTLHCLVWLDKGYLEFKQSFSGGFEWVGLKQKRNNLIVGSSTTTYRELWSLNSTSKHMTTIISKQYNSGPTSSLMDVMLVVLHDS